MPGASGHPHSPVDWFHLLDKKNQVLADSSVKKFNIQMIHEI